MIESFAGGVLPEDAGGVMPDDVELPLLSAGAIAPLVLPLPEVPVPDEEGVDESAGGVEGVAGVAGGAADGMVGAGGGVVVGSETGSAERRLQPAKAATRAPAITTVLIVLLEKGIELFI